MEKKRQFPEWQGNRSCSPAWWVGCTQVPGAHSWWSHWILITNILTPSQKRGLLLGLSTQGWFSGQCKYLPLGNTTFSGTPAREACWSLQKACLEKQTSFWQCVHHISLLKQELCTCVPCPQPCYRPV